MKYYLATENGCQWETCLFAIMDDEGIYEQIDLPNAINGPLLQNIWEREMNFTDRRLGNNWYYGRSLSRDEYYKVKHIIEFYPQVQYYYKLLNMK